MSLPRWLNSDFRSAMRLAKGRPAFRREYCQFDVGSGRRRTLSVVEDPILDLYVARINSRFSPECAARYAQVRARVMAPARLPRRSPVSYLHPVFAGICRQLGLAA